MATVEDTRFFVKGGAAYILRQKRNPLLIENDVDCEILVNPDLSPEVFNEKRLHSADICIKQILHTLRSLSAETKASILALYRHKGLAETSRIPTISMSGVAEDGIPLVHFFTDMLSHEEHDAPFHIELRPSQLYGHTSRHMAVIRLRTRTEPSLDLIDIAIPALNNTHLRHEWEHYNTHDLPVYGAWIPVLDLKSQLYNQKRARNLTNRGKSNKMKNTNTRRERRIENIERAIIFSGPRGRKKTASASRNNRIARTITAADLAALPMGPQLYYAGPRSHPVAAELLRTGGVVHAIHPHNRGRGASLGRAPRRAFIRKGTPAGSNVRLFETAIEGAPHQYLYLGPDGRFYPVKEGIFIH